ncbi:unnamed protein product [Spirodela intermedia]|uniref:Bifunctional inhibitor/plant lipid transfer protein/seed storage helical domain-containing protein n=1 Tax=Spirodela intermedia TaxID=51605 RepID=A0A7I8IY41_SPIIN|nr:unnamed protein product [Spirodela intermedia]CAA6662778.1 unnamed protein product [Spirodela intermedia]
MGRAAVVLVLVAAVAAALWTGVAAQSSCDSVILSLVPCCCTQLASVVKSQPECLCSVLSGSAGVSTTVNQTRALALPGACNVQTPSASLCSAPPPSSSPATPSTPPTNGGTKAAPPPPDADTSGGSSSRMAFPVFFCMLFAASFYAGIF